MTMPSSRSFAVILGGFIFAGLVAFAWIGADAALDVKSHERTVEVKGLAEREVPADTVIWPLQYQVASNDLNELYESVAQKNEIIRRFLADHGLDLSEATSSGPDVVDRYAQSWGDTAQIQYRYVATAAITLYSHDVDAVRRAMSEVIALGRNGIALSGQQYGNQAQFLFTKLNDIKPDMLEEATVNARAAAQKFAEDSDSTLGKIRRANQGVFSITDRDSTTPHIKKVRVVSTIEYYLSD
ncbi:MAG TPA: SIMPL domain-containing protein [Woeseiaceae bacterium]|nr:SIMPL domain-containing protein [Woeseiaceae bacterium]